MPEAANRDPSPPGAAGPPLPFGKRPLRTFGLVVALPGLLFYVTSAALVIGALGIMAREMDRTEDARGVKAIHAALDGFLGTLSDAVSDEGTWNEAYLNVVVSPNPAWMDSTWGSSARLGTIYDTVLVTDADGNVLFGEDSVGPITGDIGARFPAAHTMLDDLEDGVAVTGDATSVSGFASDAAGTAGLAAISIHKATPGEITVPRHMRRVLWIARHITPSVLQDLSAHYQAPLPELVTAIAPDSSAIELRDADGNASGAIAWTPDRPGERAFRTAALVASLIFVLIGAVMVAGLGIIRRAMLQRSTAVETALRGGALPPAGPAVGAHTTATLTAIGAVGRTSPIEGVVANDFAIAYQPVFDLRAETLVGVEALLRWRGRDAEPVHQETLAPDALSLLLERAGVLAIRHASSEIAPLLGITLSMAATGRQLEDTVFAEKVAATLAATSLPARRLQLGIDAALLPPLETVAPAIAALRLTGVSVGLDNFVLSPATLVYLRAGLVDRVRLAPSLTSGSAGDDLGLPLVRASIEAARAARLAVSIPGISSRADVAPLLRLGCREFQGDIFAPPMPIAALTALILAPARKAG